MEASENRGSRISRLPGPSAPSGLSELSESQHNSRSQSAIPGLKSLKRGIPQPATQPEPKRKPLSDRAAEYPAKASHNYATRANVVKGHALASVSSVSPSSASSTVPLLTRLVEIIIPTTACSKLREELRQGGQCDRPPCAIKEPGATAQNIQRTPRWAFRCRRPSYRHGVAVQRAEGHGKQLSHSKEGARRCTRASEDARYVTRRVSLTHC